MFPNTALFFQVFHLGSPVYPQHQNLKKSILTIFWRDHTKWTPSAATLHKSSAHRFVRQRLTPFHSVPLGSVQVAEDVFDFSERISHVAHIRRAPCPAPQLPRASFAVSLVGVSQLAPVFLKRGSKTSHNKLRFQKLGSRLLWRV